MKSTAIVLFFALSLCLASCKKENHITPDVTTTVPDISDFEMNASSAPFNVPILIAGKNDVRGLIDGPGADARFFGPGAIFVNADGTLLVGEGANKTIRKITNGVVSTVETSGYLDILQDIAATKDGTIAANCNDYLLFFKKGQTTPEVYNTCFHCTLSGLDSDPSGNYFWYLQTDRSPFTINSFLISINSTYDSPKEGGEISDNQQIRSVSTAGPNKFFTSNNNHVLEQTATGTVFQVVTTTFDGLTDIVANKNGTKIFLADGGDIKVIDKCPSCQPKRSPAVTTLVSGVDASSIALSHSEHVLFFTSSKHNTVSKINLP